jgi:hypothetical protein
MDCLSIRHELKSFSLALDCDTISNGMLRISTPFRYPDGSNIDVFVGTAAPSLLSGSPSLSVTDLGQTIASLLDVHIKPWTTKKRKQVVADICKSLGVDQKGGEFVVEIEKPNELSDAIVRVAQTCLRVSDLIFTQRLSTPVSFRDDLEEFVATADLVYESDVPIRGKFNKDVQVDFRVKGTHIESLVLTLATGSSAASHPLSNEVFRKWHDLEGLKTSHQFLSVFDSRTNVFREEDLARLNDVSTVLAFPAQEDAIRSALAA